MATTETRVTVFATPAQSSMDRRVDGVRPTQGGYGRVNVVQRTTISRVSSRGAILDTHSRDEVVLRDLDPGDVAHLIKTLTNALATSLDVRDVGLRRDRS